MKKIFYAFLVFWLNFSVVFADVTLIPKGGILENNGSEVCNFNTGDMSFACIPIYIKYLIDIIIGLAGTIALVVLMIGGFKYIFGAVSENKDSGKKTIQSALTGLIIAGMAWILVTGLVSLLTM